MAVVARPVNRSGWKLCTALTLGGGALPAEAVADPRCEASARDGSASWLTNNVRLTMPAVRREMMVIIFTYHGPAGRVKIYFE